MHYDVCYVGVAVHVVWCQLQHVLVYTSKDRNGNLLRLQRR